MWVVGDEADLELWKLELKSWEMVGDEVGFCRGICGVVSGEVGKAQGSHSCQSVKVGCRRVKWFKVRWSAVQ
jgi:hypothetical protein